MPLSKPFVVATEGATVDGRNISADQIKQMAEKYDPNAYTALANLEHYLSMIPDSLFKCYGKVVSLSTQMATVLGEKKLQLLAVVDVSEELVALQKKGQKLFASVEIFTNMAGKGFAYLGGLAFTDSPASLGTQPMKFSMAGADVEKFISQVDVSLDFSQEPDKSAGDSLFEKVSALLGFNKTQSDKVSIDQGKAIETIALSQKQIMDAFAKIEDEMKKHNVTVRLDEFSKRIDAFQKQLSENSPPNGRPPATGGNDNEEHPGY